MEILVLGGTGAIGTPLVETLSEKHILFVTSRRQRKNSKNIIYLMGDAKEKDFFNRLMNRKYDVIFDFMNYSTEELKERIEILLNHTNQYFFLSSSRCYADSKKPIVESSSRLVDICDDEEYISTDEYGLSKGREENILMSTCKNNWTIIRPYITFNSNRIQLGVYEKDYWLKRVLTGRTIVFPKDIASKKTCLTYGPDVANAMISLINNEKAFGQAFHITNGETYTWGEILEFYCSKIEKITGKKPKVKMVDNSSELMKVWNKWQIKYDRLFNRVFNNEKIESILGKYEFKSTLEGLEECLDFFLSNPTWLNTDVKYDAWFDAQCGEWANFRDISKVKEKIRYIKWRVKWGRYFKKINV